MSLANQLAPLLLAPVSDRAFTTVQFLYRYRTWPRLEQPVTLNEKIQWIKLNNRDPLLTRCVDKYEVRDYIAERVDPAVLIPLLGVYERADEVPFDALPDRFVLKATHGSGWNLICTDKQRFDVAAARGKMERWLTSNFYRIGREWAYRDVPPRIVCETFLAGADGNPPPDYKFFCFHGVPRVVQVDYDRFTGHRRNLYTPEWEPIPCAYEYARLENPPPAPEKLPELLALATKLAQDFPLVRVDLYATDTAIYFGELTFYPEKGVGRFSPRSYDAEFGSWLHL